MATAVGAGFDIDVLLKSITKADKALSNLMSNNEEASKSVINAFQKMSSQGVVHYTHELEKQLNLYKRVDAAITTTFGTAKTGFEGMKSDIVAATDSLNKMIETLKRTDEFKQNANSTRQAYEMWLRTKHREAEEHKRIENEKFEATKAAIKRQNEEYATAEANRIKAAELSAKAKQNSQSYAQSYQRLPSYAELFDEAIAREEKKREELAKKNAQREAEEHKRKIDNINKRFELIERRNKRDAQRQTEYLNSPKGALEYARGLDTDVKSINTMNQALQQLRNAQANVNLGTNEGKRIHKELGEAIRRVEGDMKRYSSLASEVSHKHKNLMNTGEQLKRALLGVFSVSAIKGYVSKLVEVRGEFELQHRALTVLVGDVAEANKLWDKTVQLAVKSPFAVKELVTYTKQLSAYRVESDKLYDTTKMLADISAGLGVDMNRLILAYGQVKAANYLRGTELRQFSEAGINVLKELSDYYTEIEEKTVSVGEVFDRVSKRMVSFQDVNAVLEKVTGAGGQFYKMQEQQAETLKGVWMNMRDSVDLMLNDIGSKNSSILKGTLSIAKSVVDNWEKVSNIIIPLFSMIVAKMAVMRTMSFFDEGSFKVGINKMTYLWRLLTKGRIAADRFALSLDGVNAKSLRMSAIGTGISAVIFLVAKLTMEFVKHRAELKAIDKEYENIRESLSDITFNFNVAKNEGDLKKQKDSLNELVSIANKEYSLGIKIDIKPMTEEEVDQKVKEITGQILRITSLSQEATKAGKGNWFANMFSDDATKDAEDYGDAFSNVSSKIILHAKNAANALIEYKNAGNDLTEVQKEAIDTFTTPFDPKKETEVQYVIRLTKAYKKLNFEANKHATQTYWEESGDQLRADIYKNYGISEEVDKAIKLLGVDEKRFKDELNRFFDSIEGDLDGDNNQRRLEIKAVIDKQSWSDSAKEFAYQLATERFGINITPIIKQPDDKTLADWQIEYNKFVDTLSTNKVLKMKTNTDVEQYISTLKGSYETYAKEIAAWDAGNAKARAQYSEDEIKAIKKQNDERKRAIDWLVYEEKKKSEENEALQRLKKQISLIREAARAYDDMRKLHDEAYASERIVSDYEDAFREAGLGDIDKYAFGTREDERNNLNKLGDSAKRVKGGMLELSKAIAQVSVNIDDANQELSDKKLFDAISDIFSNYEISLEMDKLNIPSDLAQKLFGFESIDLNEIRGKVLEKFGLGSMVGTSNQGIYDSAQFKAMSKERQDELRKSLEKESELQDNALKERLKTYTQYLKKEQDERIKLKLEELRKIHEVESMSEYSPEQKKTITNKIKDDTQKELMKLQWRDFETSSIFLNIFDDLEKSTPQALRNMSVQLDSLRESMIAAGLPASDLKEILDKINQVEEELERRSLFKSFFENLGTSANIKDFRTALADEERLIKERDELKKAENAALTNVETTKVALQVEEDRLESMSKGTEEYESQRQKVELQRQSLTAAIGLHNGILASQKRNNKQLDETQQKIKNWKDACLDIAESFNEIGNAINQVGGALGTTLEQLGLMSEETKAIYDSSMNIANDAFNLGGNIMQLVANPTNPQAWVGAITNAISLIGNIAATGDAVREKEIQAEMKKIDRLEKAYGKLEKAMEESYNTDLIKANQAALEQNIDAQIKALEAAKAAEEGKKKTDDDAVQQYADDIEELTEKKAELEKEMVETMGGTYDYAGVAEQFLDAWLSAFEETGDGLSGLGQAFDDFWKDILKKQVVYGGASTILEGFIDEINNRLKDGVLDATDVSIIDGLEEDTKAKLQEFFEYMNSKYDLTDAGKSELSGLSKGIQGITETQADILAAYWNAVRFDVSAIRQRFDEYIATQGYGEEVNPVENHLKTISLNTTAILTLLGEAKTDSEANAIRVKVINM